MPYFNNANENIQKTRTSREEHVLPSTHTSSPIQASATQTNLPAQAPVSQTNFQASLPAQEAHKQSTQSSAASASRKNILHILFSRSKTGTKNEGNELNRRVEKLSRAVLIGCFVSIASVGFGIISIATSQTLISKTTSNMQDGVIALQTIPAGTTINKDMISLSTIPKSYLSDNTFVCIDDLVGKTTSVDIPKNSQITTGHIAELGNVSSLASKLSHEQRAITITVNNSTGLSSLLKCGNKVNIYAQNNNNKSLSKLASNITVLALDGMLSGPAASNTYSNVTLQVTDAQAEDILYNEISGQLALVLTPGSEKDQ